MAKIEALYPKKKGIVILDFGCGNGIILKNHKINKSRSATYWFGCFRNGSLGGERNTP